MAMWIFVMTTLATSAAEWGSSSAEWKSGFTAGYRDALSGKLPKGPPMSLVDGAAANTGGTGTVASSTGKTVAELLKMMGATKAAASSETETDESDKGFAELAALGIADGTGTNYSLPKIQGAVYEIREKLRIIRANLSSIHDFNAVLKNNTENDAGYLTSTLDVIRNNTDTLSTVLDLYRAVHSDMAEEVVGDSMAAVSQCQDEWSCSYDEGDCGTEWDAVDSSIDLKCQYCVKAGLDPTNQSCTERSEDPCFVACTYNGVSKVPGSVDVNSNGGDKPGLEPNDGVCKPKLGIDNDWIQARNDADSSANWTCEKNCMRYFDGANITDYAGSDPYAVTEHGRGAVCVSDPCQMCTKPTSVAADFAFCTGTGMNGLNCEKNCVSDITDSAIPCRLFHSFVAVLADNTYGSLAPLDRYKTSDSGVDHDDRFKCTAIQNGYGSFFSEDSEGRLCLPECLSSQLTAPRNTCYESNATTASQCENTYQLVGGLAMQCKLQDSFCVPKYGCAPFSS